MSNDSSSTSVTLNKSLGPPVAAQNGRLSSFGVPRDLTLGGLPNLRGGRGGANKKVFVPNLNAVRNKNTSVKTSKDTSKANNKRDNSKPGRGGGVGAGRSKKDNNLIQTSSIFSEGIAQSTIKRKFESYSKRDDVPLVKPTISKTQKKFDSKAEKINLKNLLGDSEDESGDDEEDAFEKIDSKYKPVKFSKPSDILVKNVEDIYIDPDKKVEKEFFSEKNDKKIFLVQFPDVLPCEVDESNSKQDQTGANNGEKSSDKKTNEVKGGGTNLADSLEEGQIGRIVRYKSGKCRLVLGKTHYNVDFGMETNFLQELTSISTNRKERSGNIINLGPIDSKMIISPDWNFLLNENS